MTTQAEPITPLLRRWQDGDDSARNTVLRQLYNDLRKMAHQYLRKERSDRSFTTRDIVNEACLRIVQSRNLTWENRHQFFADIAACMRRLLVDHARKRHAQKRSGSVHVDLEEALAIADAPDGLLVAVDDALKDFAKDFPFDSEVVELRVFGGHTVPEIAQILKVSSSTVDRSWKLARAWLSKATR